MEKFKAFVRAIYRLFAVFLVIILFAFAGVLLYNFNPELLKSAEQEVTVWKPKAVEELFNAGSMPQDVEYGYLLIKETSAHMGPMAPEPKLRFAGNNLACANCHLKSGTQAGSASWVGVINRFPQFGGRSNREGTIEDRINGCMERSMNGRKLPEDSKEMSAIVAYMTWLGEDLPNEKEKEYEGYPEVIIPDVAIDFEKGEQLFLKECTLCHGENGQGLKYADSLKGYQYPPLWGPDSYNNGAGMNRVITAASFIKGNMPYEQATWDNPKLTDEEAYHLAGYINSFERPTKSNLEKDYPDLKLKPVSTPYGPWADNFTEEQHKYGPFQPIMAYYKKTYDLNKRK